MNASMVVVDGLAPLSPVERILFGSRLERIQQATRREFAAIAASSASASSASASANEIMAKDVVFIFHGAGGLDELTEELEHSIIMQTKKSKDDNDNNNNDNNDSSSSSRHRYRRRHWIQSWDWKTHVGSVATAAFDGEAVGTAVAQCLLEQYSTTTTSNSVEKSNDNNKTFLRSVHCIGISVGAFCANAMASTIYDATAAADNDDDEKSKNNKDTTTTTMKTKTHVRLTLLDPFCNRGLWGIGYGAKHYGLKADYAEDYLNTDDPVPSTNDPLTNHCVVFDVTNDPRRQSDFVLPKGETNYHCWPVAYYARYGYHYQQQQQQQQHSALLQKNNGNSNNDNVDDNGGGPGESSCSSSGETNAMIALPQYTPEFAKGKVIVIE